MKTSIIVGHVFGSIPFTVVWEIAIHMPYADPKPWLVAAGVLPQAVAGLSLMLLSLDPANRRTEAVPQPQLVRRQVSAARRKELAR